MASSLTFLVAAGKREKKVLKFSKIEMYKDTYLEIVLIVLNSMVHYLVIKLLEKNMDNRK